MHSEWICVINETRMWKKMTRKNVVKVVCNDLTVLNRWNQMFTAVPLLWGVLVAIYFSVGLVSLTSMKKKLTKIF